MSQFQPLEINFGIKVFFNFSINTTYLYSTCPYHNPINFSQCTPHLILFEHFLDNHSYYQKSLTPFYLFLHLLFFPHRPWLLDILAIIAYMPLVLVRGDARMNEIRRVGGGGKDNAVK